MSLGDLASIGSFVSGIAVLVSLIYVGLQVRQAKQHQQAAIRQGRADRIVTMCFQGGDPSIADAIAKGYAGAEDITATQLTQYHYVCRGLFYISRRSSFSTRKAWRTTPITPASWRAQRGFCVSRACEYNGSSSGTGSCRSS
jgi:hypothetical protein